MNKGIKILTFAIVFSIIVVICYVVYANISKSNNEKTLEEKIDSEIEYLETKLLNIANRVNNITIQNYKVTVTEIDPESGAEKASKENKSQNSSNTNSTSNESRRRK